MSTPQEISAVVYRIDNEDRLTDVNDGWIAFAATNGGEAGAVGTVTVGAMETG